MDLTKFNNENLDDCGNAVFLIIGDNDNEDNVFTHYAKTNSKSYVNKVDKAYITGCLIRQPRDIVRQISFNGRTQRVSSSVRYELQSKDVYTPEKMDEIERIFHSKHLTLNGVSVQFEGGQVFQPLSENLPNKFRLSVLLSEKELRQNFGCVPISTLPNIKIDDSITFGIPDERATIDHYYNDSGVKIANDYPALLDYFRMQDNVISVRDVAVDSVQTDVSFKHIFSVEKSGLVPTAIYVDKFSPSHKINGLILSTPGNYNELSRGMNANGSCSNIEIGDIEVIADIVCADIEIGVIEVLSAPCVVYPRNGWDCESGESYVKYIDGKKYLTLNVTNNDIDYEPSPSGQIDISFVSTTVNVCEVLNSEPVNLFDLLSVKVNGVLQDESYTLAFTTGYNFSISPCLSADDGSLIEISFKDELYINEQIVAYIEGNCLPAIRKVITNDINPQLPPNSRLTIETNGLILYAGKVINNEAKINLSNIEL